MSGEPLAELADRYFTGKLREQPLDVTVYGIPGYDALLPDPPAGRHSSTGAAAPAQRASVT